MDTIPKQFDIKFDLNIDKAKIWNNNVKISLKFLVLDELPLKSAINRGEISERITLSRGRFFFRIPKGKFPENLPSKI